MAAGAASTGADRGTDPSRVIARALRPYAERVRLARVVILVAYLAIIAAGYIIGDPPLWFVLGVTALAVVAATRGVIFVLPREVRALLPRLRGVRLRQDRWLRRMVGLDWRSDPAVVLSRLAALDPDRLTAIDRFEIVTIARLRHEPEIAARFDPPKADDEPPHLARHPRLRRGIRDRSSRIRSVPSAASMASTCPAWIPTSASYGSTRSRWRAPTRPPSRVGTSSLRSPTRGRSPTGSGTGRAGAENDELRIATRDRRRQAYGEYQSPGFSCVSQTRAPNEPCGAPLRVARQVDQPVSGGVHEAQDPRHRRSRGRRHRRRRRRARRPAVEHRGDHPVPDRHGRDRRRHRRRRRDRHRRHERLVRPVVRVAGPPRRSGRGRAARRRGPSPTSRSRSATRSRRATSSPRPTRPTSSASWPTRRPPSTRRRSSSARPRPTCPTPRTPTSRPRSARRRSRSTTPRRSCRTRARRATTWPPRSSSRR